MARRRAGNGVLTAQRGIGGQDGDVSDNPNISGRFDWIFSWHNLISY